MELFLKAHSEMFLTADICTGTCHIYDKGKE